MAFWLSLPLMDPEMFFITSGTLWFDFAIAKTVVAVGIGLLGGFTVKSFANSVIFADPLKAQPAKSCSSCGCGSNPFTGRPHWTFWDEAPRRKTFRDTALEKALFLGKWLLLAYMIEALMLHYVPAEMIAKVLGGSGIMPILLGALVVAPQVRQLRVDFWGLALSGANKINGLMVPTCPNIRSLVVARKSKNIFDMKAL
jgi:uncharacterized membrane protein YraQ (UPF0718 family)